MDLNGYGDNNTPVVDNPVGSPEIKLKIDLEGFYGREVLNLFDNTGSNHDDECHPSRIHVELCSPTSGDWVEDSNNDEYHDGQQRREMGDAAVDWRFEGVEEVAGVQGMLHSLGKLDPPAAHSALCC